MMKDMENMKKMAEENLNEYKKMLEAVKREIPKIESPCDRLCAIAKAMKIERCIMKCMMRNMMMKDMMMMSDDMMKKSMMMKMCCGSSCGSQNCGG